MRVEFILNKWDNSKVKAFIFAITTLLKIINQNYHTLDILLPYAPQNFKLPWKFVTSVRAYEQKPPLYKICCDYHNNMVSQTIQVFLSQRTNNLTLILNLLSVFVEYCKVHSVDTSLLHDTLDICICVIRKIIRILTTNLIKIN